MPPPLGLLVQTAMHLPPPGALGASCSAPPGKYRRKTILTF